MIRTIGHARSKEQGSAQCWWLYIGFCFISLHVKYIWVCGVLEKNKHHSCTWEQANWILKINKLTNEKTMKIMISYNVLSTIIQQFIYSLCKAKNNTEYRDISLWNETLLSIALLLWKSFPVVLRIYCVWLPEFHGGRPSDDHMHRVEIRERCVWGGAPGCSAHLSASGKEGRRTKIRWKASRLVTFTLFSVEAEGLFKCGEVLAELPYGWAV